MLIFNILKRLQSFIYLTIYLCISVFFLAKRLLDVFQQAVTFIKICFEFKITFLL